MADLELVLLYKMQSSNYISCVNRFCQFTHRSVDYFKIWSEKKTKRNKHVEKQHSHFEQLPKIATINSINYERKKQQFYTVCCVEVSRKVYLPSYCLGFLFISPKLNGHLDATTLFGFRICSQEGRFVWQLNSIHTWPSHSNSCLYMCDVRSEFRSVSSHKILKLYFTLFAVCEPFIIKSCRISLSPSLFLFECVCKDVSF